MSIKSESKSSVKNCHLSEKNSIESNLPDLNSVYASMPGISAVLDTAFRVVSATSEYFSATQTTENILGKEIYLIPPPFPENNIDEYQSSLKISVNKAAATRKPETMSIREHVVTTTDDHEGKIDKRYISYSFCPILDAKGELSHILYRAEDVTQFVRVGKDAILRTHEHSYSCTDDGAPINGYYAPLIILFSKNNKIDSAIYSALEGKYKVYQTSNCDYKIIQSQNMAPALLIICSDCAFEIIALLNSVRSSDESATIPAIVIADKSTDLPASIISDRSTQILYKPISSKIIRTQIDQVISKAQRIQIEQSRLAALVSSSEDAIIGAKLDGTITDWNKGAERIFGYTQNEIIGKSVQLLVPPEIYTDKNKIMNKIAQGDRIQQFETIRMRKDGTRINVSTSISPIRDTQGQITGASAITRDITQRKLTEKKMKSQAFLLEEMGQLAKVGGWEFDPKTGKGAWTSEVARIHDLDPSIEATAELGLSFFHGENREKIEIALHEAITNGTPYDLELELISAAGHKKWIRTICKPKIEDGTVTSIRGAFQDITDLKQAELEAKSSEKKLHDILEAVSDSLIVVNDDGQIVMVNSATLDMFGYPKAELLGMNIDIFVPEPYKNGHAGKCKSYFQCPDLHAPLWNKNINIRSKSGTEIPVDIALALTSIDSLPHAVASIRDISKRKKAEEALKASETKFRIITENLKELIYRADRNTFEVNYVNKAAKDIYGYTPEEWLEIPHLWEKTIHPDDKDMVLDFFVRAHQEVKDATIEYRVLDRNGKVHWVLDNMTWEKDETGNPVARLGAMTDITDQKQAMIYLTEQEKYLREILRGIKAAILIIDFKNKIVEEVNDEFIRISGKDKEQIIGASCAETLQCEAKCPKCDADGEVIQHLIFKNRSSIINTEGRRIPLEESFIPVTIRGQQRIVAVLFDITEQESLEHQLANAQKLESIGQLAAGLAHEINTPVQYVSGNLAYLRDSFATVMELLSLCEDSFGRMKSDEGQSMLAEWEQAKKDGELDFLKVDVPEAFKDTLFGVEQVSSIVKAMRKFSHPGSEKMQTINLKDSIENIITVSRNEWKYSSEIVTEFDPDLPVISCMPGSFNQAILNVLVNAAHANADATATNKKGSITITTVKKGDIAEITISDTGNGIPEKIQHRIFDPFFTTKEVGKGTGQGLGIVHSVMKKHGGSINFKTSPGQGTSFILRFPIDQEDKSGSDE
ncbi:PAS domain S-box protein [Maridesulfovibrio sp. FT414]|uniref:PAS domain S-box protein n=1 Tax=Maridesulfovibrio sp. FT414 TaxID=2979469 RepID=UPI003D80459A